MIRYESVRFTVRAAATAKAASAAAFDGAALTAAEASGHVNTSIRGSKVASGPTPSAALVAAGFGTDCASGIDHALAFCEWVIARRGRSSRSIHLHNFVSLCFA